MDGLPRWLESNRSIMTVFPDVDAVRAGSRHREGERVNILEEGSRAERERVCDLLVALDSRSWGERADAAYELGALAEDKEQVLDALSQRISVDHEPCWQVRAAAARALGRIGSASAQLALFDAEDGEPDPTVRREIRGGQRRT